MPLCGPLGDPDANESVASKINEICCAMTFGGDYYTVGFTFFASLVALVHKNQSYVECTRCSRNISLL
jgi:hypothetical protein